MTWVNFKELREKLDFREVLHHYGVEINAGNKLQHQAASVPCRRTLRDKLEAHHSPLTLNGESGSVSAAVPKAMSSTSLVAWKSSIPERADDILRKTALILADRYRTRGGAKPVVSPPKKLAPPANIPKVINAPLDFALKDLDPDHPYLLGRGFTKETIERFELGFCSRGLMKDRIAIPLRDTQGQLIGYAGRVIDDKAITEENPKYRLPAAREREGKRYEFSKTLFLYNGNNIVVPAEELVIVEGFPAVWWLVQNEFDNASRPHERCDD